MRRNGVGRNARGALRGHVTATKGNAISAGAAEEEPCWRNIVAKRRQRKRRHIQQRNSVPGLGKGTGNTGSRVKLSWVQFIFCGLGGTVGSSTIPVPRRTCAFIHMGLALAATGATVIKAVHRFFWASRTMGRQQDLCLLSRAHSPSGCVQISCSVHASVH